MRIFISIILLVLTLTSFSQEYEKSLGLRFGVTTGLTYKKFLDKSRAMEATLSTRQQGFQLTAIRMSHELSLYQYSQHIYFMYGYGGHIGYYRDSEFSAFFLPTPLKFKNKVMAPAMGIDGYIGFEYRFDNLPLALVVDYKPYFGFCLPGFHVWNDMNPFDFGFSVKYILK